MTLKNYSFEKRCTKCGEIKPLTEFSFDARNNDGRQGQCRACRRAYYAENADRLNAQSKKYRNEHLEECRARYRKYDASHREEIKIKNFNYRITHREELKQYNAKYHAAHREETRKRHTHYRETNPDIMRRCKKRYNNSEIGKNKTAARNLRLRVGGSYYFTAEFISEINSEYGNMCPYCNQNIIKGHIDHVVPVFYGGTSDRHNLIYCCEACNTSKGAKSLLEFMIYRAAFA